MEGEHRSVRCAGYWLPSIPQRKQYISIIIIIFIIFIIIFIIIIIIITTTHRVCETTFFDLVRIKKGDGDLGLAD